MVLEASLNWASILGAGLIIWSLHMSFMILWQFIFVLNKRSELNKKVFLHTVYLAYLFLFRSILIPAAGLSLFFQGWRLDPILQFSLTIIILGIFLELVPLVYNFQNKNRTLKNSIKTND